MGIYYQHAIVHDRVLIWWTDNDSVNHEVWLEGEDAQALINAANSADYIMQNSIRQRMGK